MNTEPVREGGTEGRAAGPRASLERSPTSIRGAHDAHVPLLRRAGVAMLVMLVALTGLLTPRVETQGVASSVLAAGWQHTCAVTDSGTLCWGNNSSGQLGDGTTIPRKIPVAVLGLTNGVSVLAAGTLHTCAVDAGTVLCWGSNASGQLGDGTKISRSTPAAVAGLGTGVRSVTAGASHTCALTSGRTVMCWGANGTGSLGDGTSNDSSTPVSVVGLPADVASIHAGDYHTCAVTLGGAVWCWGNNQWGQLGDDTTSQRNTPVEVGGISGGVAALSAGTGHTCLVLATGAAKCWGFNGYGQLGEGTTTLRKTPFEVSGISTGTGGDVGRYHSCAVIYDGAVKCWGWNYEGQLGDGTAIDRWTPVAVVGLTIGVTAVSAGGDHTCAAKNDGTLLCWGRNSSGQLGDGTMTSRTSPVGVIGFGGLLPPTVSSVVPIAGSELGGTTVTITGANFVVSEPTTATFGGTAASNVTVVNATTLRAVTPAHPTGLVDVMVTTLGGSGTKWNAFTFVPRLAPFTDEPLVPGSTAVKVVHVTELRQPIDELRIRYGLAAFPWNDATLVAGGTPVKAIHLTELWTALDAVYAAAGLPLPTYTTPVIVAGTTVVTAADIAEIRAAVAAIW